ncbi:flavin reductase family protein [Burkholderia ubonensis]|nr:flavin reductase family protein [Burkholderia ubonensis]KVU22098.1 hypothetical protein WK64_30380 [Burkholderia ubonensis]
MTFGRNVNQPADIFAIGDRRLTANGLPHLADAQSSLVCRIVSVFEHGTHSVFERTGGRTVALRERRV